MNRPQHGPRAGLVIGAVVAVLALVAAALFVWPGFLTGTDTLADDPAATDAGASAAGAGPDAAVADPPVPPARVRIVPMVDSGVAPTAEGVAKQLSGPLEEGRVQQLTGIVIDPVADEVLWERDPAKPVLPASTMKLVTGATLAASADLSKRLETKIVRGTEPGQVVFVGGGDVTLTARPEGTPSVLSGGPRVDDLAEQLIQRGEQVSEIVLDLSYWTGPEMADGWRSDDIRGTSLAAQGYITLMQPLMVDADRLDPNNENSPRTGEPAMTAGKALATALGDDSIPITVGQADDGAEVLATVYSQPLTTLLAQALEQSDNVLSEALAREVAIARGAPASFAGVSAAMMQALQDLGLDTTGVRIVDGSGISTQNLVPQTVLGAVMAMAVEGEEGLSTVLTGLPLAGVSGTLSPPRFSQPENEAGAGWVRAKTGSIEVTYALVGYVPDEDGRILVFSFNSNNVDSDEAKGTRPAIDALAAALRQCGCS